MDEQEQITDSETGGMTFREFFKTVWLCKWLALIVAVAVAAIGVISLYFGYNKSQSVYEASFSMNLPEQSNNNNNAAYVYPDGKQFYYTDMISLETLQDIKASNAEFAGIDVEKMASSGAISIKREAEEQSGASTGNFVYTVTVKTRYFSNGNQAREFLRKVSSVPVEYIAGMKIDYGAYLGLAGLADDFETEISFLKSQMDELRQGYGKLISSYGASFVGDGESGKTLLAFSQEVGVYTDVENLLTEARGVNGGAPILKSADDKKTYEIELATLTAEYNKQKEILDALLTYRGNVSGNAEGNIKASIIAYADDNSGTPIIAGEQIVLEQAQLVADLNEKVTNLKNYVDKGEVDSDGSFNAKVAKAYERVRTLTETYTKTVSSVYSKSSQVSYVMPSVIAVSGGMSLIMIVLLSVVIGLIVGILAAFIAGRLKYKKGAEAVSCANANAGATSDKAQSNVKNDAKTDFDAEDPKK